MQQITTTISTKGQVTIPSYVRESLHIKTGEKILVQSANPRTKEIVLKVLTSQQNIESLYGVLASHNKKTNQYVPLKTVRSKVGKKLGQRYAVKK
ncbi:AbrB/MazE/SpoVT family DNA-binding domain-containing protein [Candidatus Woesebacteria bacterium]|nr:AbrB/MazE/SpoVT family DNA-binding domain-containing protein [Candidatus Woesebacteria bacterium]